MNIRFLVVPVLLAASTAAIAEGRINYAEPLSLAVSQDSTTTQKTSRNRILNFDAYGRSFQLDLEPNDRLLKAVRGGQKNTQVYRGRVHGLSASWVRLSRNSAGLYSGAVWDGRDLYLIQPSAAVTRSLLAPLNAPDTGQLIFRLADTQGVLPNAFCPVAHSTRPIAPASGKSEFNSFLAELQTNAATSAPLSGEVEVAMVGDSLFSSFYSNPTEQILEWMNVVDGIFSEQVGIRIVPTDFLYFQTGTDPFVGIDAEELLKQLGTYRSTHPTIRARGLAHMLTIKNMGDILGLGSLGGLCDAQYGVSLSRTSYDTFATPFVIAHELGHNFGAPHDAEAGSACESTPSGYLMGNLGERFSDCSLAQIRPVVAAATCVQPLRTADVSVSVAVSAGVLVGRPFNIPVDVSAVGSRTVEGVSFQLILADQSALTLISASSSQAACSVGGNFVSCNLGSIAPGESRRIFIDATAQRPGIIEADATVHGISDAVSSNDRQHIVFNARPVSDVAISSVTPQITALAQETFEMAFDLESTAPETSTDVQADIYLPQTGPYAIVLEDVDAGSGSCNRLGDFLHCDVGDLAAGEVRRVSIRAHAPRAFTHSGESTVSAANEVDLSNNSSTVDLIVNPAADVGIHGVFSSAAAVVGVPLDYIVDITAAGVLASNDVSASVAIASGFTIQQVDSASVSCAIVARTVSCSLGTMAAGETRRITLRLLPMFTYLTNLTASVSAARDDYTANNAEQASVQTRYAVDAGLAGSYSAVGMEGREASVDVTLKSLGAGSAANVVITVATAAGHPFVSGSVENGTCEATTLQLKCILASLSSDTVVTARYQTGDPGTFAMTFSVAAELDGDSGNNSASVNVSVLTATDIRIESVPDVVQAWSGETVTIPVTIASDRRALSDVNFTMSGDSRVAIQSATVADGTCAVRSSRDSLVCTIAEFPAATARQIDLVLKVGTGPNDALLVFNVGVSSGADNDPSNDAGTFRMAIQYADDVVLTVGAIDASSRAGQAFDYPAVKIFSSTDIEDAVVEISLPDSAVISGGGDCEAMLGGARCRLGAIPAEQPRSLRLNLRINASGQFTSKIKLSATPDADSSNNSRDVLLLIGPALSSSGGNGGSGGGGGGGAASVEELLLTALFVVFRIRAARRRRCARRCFHFEHHV